MEQAPATWALPRSAMAVLIAAVVAAGSLLATEPGDYPHLHTILDTGMALMSGILALVLWDLGGQTGRQFPKWLAVSFAAAFALNLVHVLVTVEWSGSLAAISQAKASLRPSTWPPSTHLLPIGILMALWLLRRGAVRVLPYAAVVSVLAMILFVAFQGVPTYLPPGPLGVTRPALVAPPVLWAVVLVMTMRARAETRLAAPLAWMAGTLVVANTLMLYSRAPADGPAMAAHLGRVAAHLVLFLSVMQMASRSVRERVSAEAKLASLAEDLDLRVIERTVELASANAALEDEMAVRRKAEETTRAQVERLFLLHQITRAIGERQDLASIFQVIVRSVENQLPSDFACLCLYDGLDRALTVSAVGVGSAPLALELAMTENARVDIDENGLSRCVRGELVYEPDLAGLDFPFPRRLAQGGLRSMVAAPLQIESKVFGVLVVARLQPQAFASAECEFLRQLSEHAALAAHQAQLHGALQDAYDDLRHSQQAVMQQERLRALGQMASGIAHDINNALSPVALYTESILDTEADLSPTVRGQLEIIQRAVGDVTQTIARMREFYRLREPQLDLTAVDLNLLAQQVIDLTKARWSDMAIQRGVVIEVRTELAGDLPPVMGAESEIREALINLVLNAVDALPDGGLLTLRTRIAGDASDTVDVEVADEGAGMDEVTRQRCLEPFFTTKGERGTGLGLAMVYGVVQRHGADMDLRSAPGAGTTVRLRFPAVSARPSAPASAGGRPIAPTRLRILLVDDDPILLRALDDALQADGHVVSVANGGQAGIDAFRAAHARDEPFAAVITDLGMPYVDGRKVAAELKTLSPSTPVLLLTGWGRGLMADADVPAHVDQVLGKPPKLREIREALARHCATALAE